MVSTCPSCGSSNPGDFEDAGGQLVCTKCGAVVSDSHIVSEITFSENSAGAAIVQGHFVGHNQTHASSGGRYRAGGTIESREQTIAEGRRQINQLAAVLTCPEFYADAAQRWYTLAVTNNFTKGRKTRYVVACCLYIVCRQQKSSHMLIDFSDVLHINVFVLGQTYLKLIRLLSVRIPNIDPTVYVHRFAKHLEFGTDQNKVAKDALRIIQRMDRDWIVQGRRPSGACGAALILAARMNNYRRSVREVVYVVKVAELTVHKRLQEFKDTKSGDLTVAEFRNIWLEQAHDPPSFGPKKKKRKVRRVDESGEVVFEEVEASADPKGKGKDPVRDADGFVIPQPPEKDVPIDPALLKEGATPSSASAVPPPATPPADDDDTVDPSDPLASEINDILQAPDTSDIVASLAAARAAAQSPSTVSSDPEDLADVDDDPEVAECILNDEEAATKEKIWTEFNRDWIRDQEVKRLKKIADERNGIIKKESKRKKRTKPRDSTAPDLAASPAESAKEMLKRRGYSRKINYAVMDSLFEDD